MKKLFGLLLMATLVFTAGLVFGQSDSTATSGEAGGLSSFLTWDRISGILSALGIIGWLVYRLNLVKAALNEVIVAAEDGNVSETEFQKIVKAVKAIWGKKPDTK